MSRSSVPEDCGCVLQACVPTSVLATQARVWVRTGASATAASPPPRETSRTTAWQVSPLHRSTVENYRVDHSHCSCTSAIHTIVVVVVGGGGGVVGGACACACTCACSRV